MGVNCKCIVMYVMYGTLDFIWLNDKTACKELAIKGRYKNKTKHTTNFIRFSFS